jgi:dTMP kinase
MKGKFIVLEGIDNCGKSTQAKMLEKYFQEQGAEVVLAREPGGTQIGEEIREVVLKPRDEMANPITQTLLFYAARTEFMNQIVKPNIDAGKMVITDRFESSTYVYQGIVQGVDLSLLDTLSEYCVPRWVALHSGRWIPSRSCRSSCRVSRHSRLYH